MKNIKYKTILIFFIFSFVIPSVLMAGSMDDIKKRFLERKDQISSLLNQKKIGENNRGLLSEKGNISSSEKKLIEAENKDRQKVYKAIAKKNGTSLDSVAKIRAQKIVEKLSSGMLYQDASGSWKNK